MEYNLQDGWRSVWVAGNEIWSNPCTQHVHDIYEWSVEAIFGKICHCVPQGHTDFKSDKRGTLVTYLTSPAEAKSREFVGESIEVLLHAKGIVLCKISDFHTRNEDGTT